jgi:hypothetical protein
MKRKVINSITILVSLLLVTVLAFFQYAGSDDAPQPPGPPSPKPPCCLLLKPTMPEVSATAYRERFARVGKPTTIIPIEIIKTGEEKLFGVIKSIKITPTQNELQLRVLSTILRSAVDDVSKQGYTLTFQATHLDIIQGFKEGMFVLLFPMQKEPLMYDIARIPNLEK